MTARADSNTTKPQSSEPSVWFGLATAVLFFVATGALAYVNVQTVRDDNRLVVHSHQVIVALQQLFSTLQDAETGQRGFLLTGSESYLDPYRLATRDAPARLTEIQGLTVDNPRQQERLRALKTHIEAKLAELQQTIESRHEQGEAAALAVVQTNRGKQEMDAIRAETSSLVQEELGLREQRLQEMDGAYQRAIVSGALSGALGLVLTGVVGFLVFRAEAARRRLQWLQLGRAGLAQAMLGDQPTDQLGDNILGHLCRYLDAHAGAVFIREPGGRFQRVATYGVPAGATVPIGFGPGDGLLGQAVSESRPILIRDVPDGYLTVGSALGRGKPMQLVVSPASVDGLTNAVVELGFLHPLNPDALALLDQMAEGIGIAVRSANYRVELQSFLEETQRQAEELQAQGEELRVSNEELEEQSRALKESQSRLEQQQTELEQTNSQLEEQARQLESQRDDLERANHVVHLRAQELEQATRYKSDFLANMSHELRTPLNSLLILAKLLADNPDDNLTEEQVRYAQTIQSSGADLLTLINDILDLSKIEAGHMEIKPVPVSIPRLKKDLLDLFAPLAETKGLELVIDIAPDCPRTVDTDEQRLEQILRNLVSNALKFTDRGRVKLSVQPIADDRVSFSVADTGIGISEAQQEAVFEAFQQGDGTTSRKYGGTGLGLSISRELTRLLGGSLTMRSAKGQGSTFTVVIPQAYSAANVQARAEVLPPVEVSAPRGREPHNSAGSSEVQSERALHGEGRPILEDDRDHLSGAHRVLLVIEDDPSFARILRDLSHEMEFECLVAQSAVDALSLAKAHVPDAVVLDVGLPDHSGLWVLDQLKRDSQTRHIPVHVVSAADTAETALSLGAVGYLLKPVSRDELFGALKRLEGRLERHARRILIVEDDAIQREAVRKLLQSPGVVTVTAATANECLEQLRDHTFDCMILDLSLPDASGYSLLETLSREDAYSFPPVIVYTGRDLSSDEEQRLRRYSKSIIIKGAKSPERLLDEVSLFLHQVVSDLPPEQQRMIRKAQNRDALLEGKRILVVEDDVRNVFSLTSILEPRGAVLEIARNGHEAIEALEKSINGARIDLVLMDVMMPVMDGLAATRQIRHNPIWKKLPIIMLTAKAMRDDQERCLEAGANDYMAKPLDVEKLLSLVRVWMPR